VIKAFLAYLLLCAMCAGGWAGTTYYVAPNGTDKNPGTSEQPFATLQKAAEYRFIGWRSWDQATLTSAWAAGKSEGIA
jgi:hypothetical protein